MTRSAALLPALGGAILERLDSGLFVVRGARPSWLEQLWRDERPGEEPFVLEEVFPFLAIFLPEAEQVWSGEAGARADSDFWTETDPSGSSIHLEAAAIRIHGRSLLVIMRNDRLFLEKQRVLQRARELRITHDALMRELEQKDVLVHAIVHDLAAPLHSVMGVLSLLGEQANEGRAAEWIHLGIQAASRQRALISEILDIFAADSGAQPHQITGGVDLDEILTEVIEERAPAARSRALRIETEERVRPCQVVAEPTRLFRVLTNLVDNALRHAPVGSAVKVSVARQGGGVLVRVEDEGPGVPAATLPRLFEKFAWGGQSASGHGLGLFFCRITLEGWGGGIGYEPRDEGGARFWIRLEPATPAEREVERTSRGVAERSEHHVEAAAGRR